MDQKNFFFNMRQSMLLSLLLFFPAAVSAHSSSKASSNPYKIVCYLGSWAYYRPGDGKFVIEDIDPNLCTHLIYAFAKLSENKIASFDPYLDLKENYGLGAYERFNDLKQKKKNLKTLIAIGGWNEGSTTYSEMASNAANRRIFVDSCVEYLKKYGFDGLDIDWEYPANRGGKAEDRENFVLLIKELSEAFRPHGFLLTAAVSAGKQTIDSAYDVPALGKYLDFINLMTYDFHGGWDTVTGHNSPLYPRPDESEANKMLNVDFAVNYWLSKGCPSNKLILGMPLYGRGFSLQNPTKNGLDAPTNGKSQPGEYTREPGMLGYMEMCKKLGSEKGWKVVFESNIQAPYAFRDNQWIGYDNEKSIYLKVKYLIMMKLGGGMVWSIETDDFRGLCQGQRYPLLQTINDALNGKSIATTNSVQRNSITEIFGETSSDSPKIPPSLTATAFSPTTKKIADDFLPCRHSGYYKHPRDSQSFYYCQSTTKENLIYMFRCGEGTVYDPNLGICLFPYFGTTNSVQHNSITAIFRETSSVSPKILPSVTTTKKIGDDFLPCSRNGYYKHPRDCKLFYICQTTTEENLIYVFRCGIGAVYDPSLKVCSFPYLVPGCSE